jgi:hypothetical protein
MIAGTGTSLLFSSSILAQRNATASFLFLRRIELIFE